MTWLNDDARPIDVRWRSEGAGGEISAAHTGYDRLLMAGVPRNEARER